MKRIMLVAAEKRFRLKLAFDLEGAGYEVTSVASVEDVLAIFEARDPNPPDLMLLDIHMSGKSGLELLDELQETRFQLPTIVICKDASFADTVAALGLGAHDLLERPFSKQRLMQSIKNCLNFFELQRQVNQHRQCQTKQYPMLGDSKPLKALRAQLLKIAPSRGRVLIMGESGTGKELVAKFIHRFSPRAGGPFVKINCASLPSSFIEDELFGHVRGAYSGAHQDKPGLFEDAHRGTLLLDEIGDMDFELQTRLLRVLEDGVIRRVGGRREIQVDVRVLAATHKDLPRLVAAGAFREDLYFRLNTLPVRVPPLRERGADIALLANYFLNHFCQMNQAAPKKLTPQALKLLEAYHWPGNVRELRNLSERLAILGGDPVQPGDLPQHVLKQQSQLKLRTVITTTPMGQPLNLKRFKTQCEKEYIESCLQRFNWDYVATAKALGIQRTYLHRKIAQLAIRKPKRERNRALEATQ